MRFGVMLQPRSLASTRAAAIAGERHGLHWIGVCDSPTVYQESYLHQAEVAHAAPSVTTGPMVSHVVVRHPLVVGNALATLAELTGGRVIGTLATGNSAARGPGLRPATIADLGEAVHAIQGYWRGEGGTFKGSRIPATGIARRGCPLLVSADGPKAAALAGEVGDGLLYGGTLDPEVRRRRLAAARIEGDRQAWIAPTVSFGEDHAAVRDDLGPMVVAMANRAMRGDLSERNVPEEIQADVLTMRKAYDYGFHADTTRPKNTSVVSDRLAGHLIDHLCVWGDEARMQAAIDAVAQEGWTGIMFVLGQADQVAAVHALGERLRRLGHLSPVAG
ncbi:LLM class flavin-dependent oxidoreductase [Baekduia soli]|uniref:LLM class flavin-dependent oxidoreductase n=1 Tax=Baekduia soli TaxID=496014 RepID=A0A5B8U5B5_9ACTN|nr:LLM class flavin-dependent oxidoreductase [Baekduia soli]QEC48131.1 LLM class flavin-dependent oxidoreductase [Baekduia soli]